MRATALLTRGSLGAFGAGALATLAFAPFGLYPVALLSVAVLFRLWQDGSRRGNFRLGWLFGLGLLGFGVFWLHISISQFGNLGLIPAILITLAFILATALYYGLAGWLAGRLGGAMGITSLVLVFPAVWTLFEWLRGWVLTGFPWLVMGYALVESPLSGYAPLIGVFGLSWLLALSASLLVVLIRYPGRSRTLAMVSLAAIWGTGLLLGQQHWTTAAGPPIRVALIQGNVAQAIKWQPEQLRPTLRLYQDLSARHWDSDLIIWPETAVPAFYHQVDAEFLTPLETEVRARDSEILLGLPIRNAGDRRYFNSMLKLGKDRDAYHKRHLVPFGEFLPLSAVLGPIIDQLKIPMSDFSTGSDSKTVLTLAGHPAGISICYEDAFGSETIQALPEAEFLVNASNDAWFGDSLAPAQHLQIARMRALETERPLLRATNTGISAIIGPRGELKGTIPSFVSDTLSGEITPRRGLTPYARGGNAPVICLMLLLIGLGLWLERRAPRAMRTPA